METFGKISGHKKIAECCIADNSEDTIKVEWETDSHVNERGFRRMYIVTQKNMKLFVSAKLGTLNGHTQHSTKCKTATNIRD